MFNSDIFANRPNFGIVGRIFISTDTAEIYRDTGTSWVLIADTSSGGTITGSGTTGTIPIWSGSTSLGNSSLVEAALQITSSKDLLVNGNAFVIETSTAANNAASLAAYGQNTLGYAAAFSSNNIGAIYGAVAGINLQTFDGSATFAQANLASAGVFVNSIDFSSPGSTITMTQSSGIRAMTGNQVQLQYQGTNSGTINHAAVQQNLGFYRPPGAPGILTITNAYSHLINALDDYGAGFTFTNRFGIYQAGASDVNYFAASVLIGTNVDSGFKLDCIGNARFAGNVDLNQDGGTTGLRYTLNNLRTNEKQYAIVNGGVDINNFQKLSIRNGSIGTNLLQLNDVGTIFLQEIKAGKSSILNVIAAQNGVGGGNRQFDLSFTPIGTNGFIGTDNGDQGYGYFSVAISSGKTYEIQVTVTTINGIPFVLFTSSGLNFVTDTIQTISNNTNDGTFSYQFTASNNASFVGFGFIRNSATLNATISNFSIVEINGILITNNETVTINGLLNTNGLFLNGTLRIDGQRSATSGGNSGEHLIINLDGTQYKIKLENN